MKKIPFLIAASLLVSPAFAQSSPSPADQANALYQKGKTAEKAGDPVAAKEAYAAALKMNPNHANARFSLGQVKIHSDSIAAKGREAKFGAVVIPEFKLDDATLKESLDALQLLVEKASKEEVTPNFIIEDPKGKLSDARITLVLKATPAKGIMKYLMSQTHAKERYDEYAIIITPK